jgi:hypothetical protein
MKHKEVKKKEQKVKRELWQDEFDHICDEIVDGDDFEEMEFFVKDLLSSERKKALKELNEKIEKLIGLSKPSILIFQIRNLIKWEKEKKKET